MNHAADYDATDYNATDYNADEWGQYRSLSTLAVVALVLGLCSVVAFASPLMGVVPLVAAATALLALKGISASEGGLSGARLARWGLALAILFGVASITRGKVAEMILQRQADRVGRQWLSMAAEGRAESMLELMTKDALDKISPAVEAGQPMPFFGEILASALIRQDPLVVELMELRKTGDIRFQLEDSGVIAASNPPQAFLRYATNSANSEPRFGSMVLKRFQASKTEEVWLVDSWEFE